MAAGETFESHTYKDIPVHSLYGENRRPTAKMLDEIDTMVVDIQDVGIRHYTYFSSLAYIMEECAKAKKQVVVLDRPNPLGGAMQGPVLKSEYKTFIGLYELPLRHGLTIGEFASYINATQHIGCELAGGAYEGMVTQRAVAGYRFAMGTDISADSYGGDRFPVWRYRCKR